MSKTKINYVGNRIRKWSENQLRERTNVALKLQDELFAVDHAKDTDDQLIAYVKQCARELGHAPCQNEVIGGKFLSARFGCWINLIKAAGLPVPRIAPKPGRRKIYQDEYKRQAQLLKKEASSNREARREKHEKQAAINRAEKAARLERDMVWGTEHDTDTDEQLLEYVRQSAAELGHSPFSREILGGQYLAQRFGGWPVVLTLAQLPLPKGMKPPTNSKILEYHRKQNEIT